MLGNANGIDLNNADLEDLDRIGGLGRVLALRIIQNRPIQTWEELEKIEGFDHELVNDLRGSGATLGRTKPSSIKKPLSMEIAETQRKARAEAKVSSGPKKLSKNIFSGEE